MEPSSAREAYASSRSSSCAVRLRVASVHLAPVRVPFDQGGFDDRENRRPARRVHPDVRVRVSRGLRIGQQVCLVDRFAHRDHRPPVATRPRQGVRELALEQQPVVEDHVRTEQFRDVRARRTVKVWVHTRPHHALDVRPIARDVTRHVRDHPRRAEDGGLLTTIARRTRGRRQEKREQDRAESDKCSEHKSGSCSNTGHHVCSICYIHGAGRANRPFRHSNAEIGCFG